MEQGTCLKCHYRFGCLEFTAFSSPPGVILEQKDLAIKARELFKNCDCFKMKEEVIYSESGGCAKTDPGFDHSEAHGHRLAGGYYHRGRFPW